MPLVLIACLPRLMRCAIVASGTRNARAISAVVSPPTARSVSATCDAGVRAGWAQRKSSVSVSSESTGSSSPRTSAAAISSRRCRA